MNVRQLRNEAPAKFDYAAGICSGGCSDLDMVWERGGHFLIIENKRPGEALSTGQMITLRALDALPNFTVWVVRGNPPSEIQSAGPLGGEQYPVTVTQIRSRIQRWWKDHGTNTKAA